MIVNAAHAIGDVVGKEGSKKGKIRVQTRNSEGWAEIRIQDTGAGIPEKARPRIFEPFFTTKEIGKGTGQGLAIARSVIVDKHAGSIHFETELGKGTTFIIRIPHDGKSIAKERCEFSSSAAGSP
jgi:signal transduction histidine kinase